MPSSNSSEWLERCYNASYDEMFPYPNHDTHIDIVDSEPSGLGFAESLVAHSDIAVIAEHKRCSPSEGEIRPSSSVEWVAHKYAEGGASALSVLIQNRYFGGFTSDIRDAHEASGLPVLCKDFIRSEHQLQYAKALGASAVLLIVAGLDDSQLQNLMQESEQIGMECLIEVHDEAELNRALKVSPKLVGLNNRNLNTLKVDLGNVRNLLPAVPDGIITVAESGYMVSNLDHIRQLRELGADAVLIGTDLMRAADPAEALSSWLATDR